MITKRRLMVSSMLCASTVMAVGLVAFSVQAQDQVQDQAQGAASAVPAEADGGIAEVVVTAQRTRSLASKTPVALTAVSGDDLRTSGVDSPTTLGARVPNLQMDQTGTALRITIRGVTSQDTSEKGDPSAAFMLDGIYIARSDAQNVAFYDIARVEVLRGPQGTLYGRNTTAGAVNVISNEPRPTFEAALNATLGHFQTRNLDGMINVPINDAVAVRGAFSINKRDSYLRNGQGTSFDLPLDRDDASARLSAKFSLTPSMTLILRSDYSKINTLAGEVESRNFFSDELTTNPVYLSPSSKEARTLKYNNTNGPLQQSDTDNSTWGIGAEFNWDLGPATLTYQGSHRNFKRYEVGNQIFGFAPNFYFGARSILTGDYDQDSHEIRIANNGEGPLKIQGGVYYFEEVSNINYVLQDLQGLVGYPYYAFPQGPTTNISRAAFVQGTYKLTDRLRVTTGVRYSEDEKSRYGSSNLQNAFTYNAGTDPVRSLNAASLKTNKIIWRAGVDFDLTQATLLYGTVATGYKAGGFNDGCLTGSSYNGLACTANTAPELLFYQPEELTSYEGGIKTRFWGGKARLNASAFYYDYTNLQLSGAVLVNNAPQLTTTNAASAEVKGIEVEGEVRPDNANHFTYSVALLDAKYAEYKPDGTTSWEGVQLDRSPKTVITLGYNRTFELPTDATLKVGLFSRWSDKYLISVPSKLIQYHLPSITKSDINVTYTPNMAAWDLQLYIKNIEDKVYPVSLGGSGAATPSEPRTYGLRLGYRF